VNSTVFSVRSIAVTIGSSALELSAARSSNMIRRGAGFRGVSGARTGEVTTAVSAAKDLNPFNGGAGTDVKETGCVPVT
jgi:hypothetical protein